MVADSESCIKLSNDGWSAQSIVRIIVAEDDPTLLKLYPVLFKNMPGLKIGRSFANGRDLVDYFLHESTASSDAVSTEDCKVVVLTDYKMPIMNGTDAAMEIRKIDPNVKIVCVSGLEIPSEDRKCFDRIIKKPFSAKDLAETLHGLFGR
jgi:CheY-like chemotaxis protein